MIRTLFLMALLFAAGSRADAQQVYGFIGGASLRGGDFRYGFGGELGGVIRVAGELGGAGKTAIVSGSLAVHPLPTRFDPFVATGPSVFAGGGETGIGWHIGVGANYWFRSNIGMRVEYRGYTGWDVARFSEMRVGVGFRL